MEKINIPMRGTLKEIKEIWEVFNEDNLIARLLQLSNLFADNTEYFIQESCIILSAKIPDNENAFIRTTWTLEGELKLNVFIIYGKVKVNEKVNNFLRDLLFDINIYMKEVF